MFTADHVSGHIATIIRDVKWRARTGHTIYLQSLDYIQLQLIGQKGSQLPGSPSKFVKCST